MIGESFCLWSWGVQKLGSLMDPWIMFRLSLREWIHVLSVYWVKVRGVFWERIGVISPASSWVMDREHSMRDAVSFLSLTLPSIIIICL